MSEAVITWRYRAEDASGAVKNGFVNAPDEAAAIADLRGRSLMPILMERQKKLAIEKLTQSGRRSSLPIPDVASITRRLSDLLNAGLPLARAVDIGTRHAANVRQQAFFVALGEKIAAGKSMSEAAAGVDPPLPPLMLAIVRSGERIGDLPNQLRMAARHYDELLRLRREISTQMTYPLALMVLIVMTLIFLSFFVLPQFEDVFASSGAIPPIETRVALAGGALIRSYIAFTPALMLAAFFLFHIVRQRYGEFFDSVLLATPAIGRIRRDNEVGRFCRTLATTLSGGMSLSDAMPLAADTITSRELQNAAREIEQEVRTGGRVAEAVANWAKPSETIISFLEIGEESGELAAMAGEAARFAEKQTKNAIKKSMSVLSPLLTAVMGLVTAAVIAAVMSGILTLNDAMF